MLVEDGMVAFVLSNQDRCSSRLWRVICGLHCSLCRAFKATQLVLFWLKEQYHLCLSLVMLMVVSAKMK